jgi:membrane protein
MAATRATVRTLGRAGRLLWDAFREWLADRCDGLAGGLAFHGGLALAPFLAGILWAVTRLLGEPWARAHFLPVLAVWIGQQRVVAIHAILQHTRGLSPQDLWGLDIVGALGLLIGALGYFKMMQVSLLTVWNVRRDSARVSYQLKKWVTALGCALASGVIILAGLMLACLVFWLLGPDGRAAAPVAWGLQTATAFGTLWALVALWLGLLLPVRLTWRQILPWAAFITALHLAGRTILVWHMGGPAAGSEPDIAESIILTLLWLYYVSMVFLYGAELMRLYLQRHGRALHS